jgi:hypothetical protein
VKTLCRAAILLLVILLAGCQRQADQAPVDIKLSVEPSPPKVGPAQLMLEVADADGKAVEGATLRLEGNMAHAGMKPVFAEAKEEKPGRYRAELRFTMGGDWFVLVEGKLADGRAFRKKIDVPGVKSK